MLRFELGHPAPLPRRQLPVFTVLERFSAGPAKISDRLLLSHTRPISKPLILGAPPGQAFIEVRWPTLHLDAGLN
jgi:hypothetical protein